MTEKQFIWKCDDENCQIYDTKKKKVYFNVEVVDLLNEQQTTISALKGENAKLKKEYKIAIDEMVTDYKKLEKENEMLRILLKDIYVDDELRKLAERYGVENE